MKMRKSSTWSSICMFLVLGMVACSSSSSTNNTNTTTAYTAADLNGTWYAAGIKTPIKNTSSSANFGYDVDQIVISNGTATRTTVATSDVTGTGTFSPTITSDGVISTGDPNDFWFMNASKDVMYHFWTDSGTGEQQLFVFMKKKQ